MAASSTADRIRSIVVSHFKVGRERVTEQTALGDDLGADDLDRLELGLAIEEAFAINLDDELYQATTVGDVVTAVDDVRLGRPMKKVAAQ